MRISTPMRTTLRRLRSGALAAAFVSIQLASSLLLVTGQATAATTTPTPAANPSLSQSCGLDIAIVVDNSTSIETSEMNQMKSALTAFTNALAGTPTQFSVTRFASSASVIQSFTSNVTTVNNAINGIPVGGGFTNWEDGFIKANSTLPNRSNPNLVIFASDGDPTASSAGSNDINQPNAHLAPAITAANTIKNGGTRILAIGIGDPTLSRLQAISGPNANTGNVLTSDVITTNFSTLASDLATFAKQTCGGTITTKKIIDQDGNLNTTNDQSTAAGWSFDINGTPTNPAAEVTAANGQTPAVKVAAGTYSVNEAQQAGYQLLAASCTGASNNGAKQGDAVVGITVANEDIVSCTFINTPSRGTVQVNKKLDKDGNGTFESGNSEAQALGMNWQLDGGTATAFGANVTNVLTGNHSVSETMPAGYHFVSWYNTLNQQQSCANPASTSLPTQIAVAANVTTNITLCNARDSGTIRVIKKVINDNGGTLQASDFNLHVLNGGVDVTGSPAAGSASGTTYTLPTGTYSVSEDAKAGYSQISLSCVNQNLQAVAHPVVLSKDQTVTCTIINDDQAPTITVTKNVVNPYGNPLAVAAFPLFVDGTGVTSGVTYNTFNAGFFTITETQQAGYELTDASGDCTLLKGIDSAASITLTNGVHSTCVLTNTAIQPRLNVVKKVINDNSGTASPSDFTMVVTGTSGTNQFPGNPLGTGLLLNEGTFNVSEESFEGYTQSLEGDCSGTIAIGEVKTCVVINDDIAHPSIQVTKYGPDTAYEGDTVNYNFVVTNTGDTKLKNISLSDDIAIDEACPKTSLAVGESMYCTAQYTIPTPQIADVTNIVTVTGEDCDGTPVDDTDTHTLDVLHYGINVKKDGPTTATAGSKVTYTFTVTNTGDMPLSSIDVNDDIAGEAVYISGDTNLNSQLDVSETWIFTANYKIPVGQTAPVVNTVEACGNNLPVAEDWDDEWESEVFESDRRIVNENQIIVRPRFVEACDTDSHTTTISTPQVLGASTTTPTLAVTGDSLVSVIALTALFVSSTAGAILAIRKR